MIVAFTADGRREADLKTPGEVHTNPFVTIALDRQSTGGKMWCYACTRGSSTCISSGAANASADAALAR